MNISSPNNNFWKPITCLTEIEKDISHLGYSKAFIESNQQLASKSSHWSELTSGTVCFFEPLEVCIQNGEVVFRENPALSHREIPEQFETQLGVFLNHNNGEFPSWLSKEGYETPSEEQKRIHRMFGRDNYFLEGNYCAMFDCGAFTYAVSNLMHMGLGSFKLVQINRDLIPKTVFSTSMYSGWLALEFCGHIEHDRGSFVIASGFHRLERKQQDERDQYLDKIFVFEIKESGSCHIAHEWDMRISSSSNLVVNEEQVYFGQNKMVTRLDLSTGQLAYFTNKSKEEIAALVSR